MSIYRFNIVRVNYLAIFLLMNVFNYSVFRYGLSGGQIPEIILLIPELLRPLISIFYLLFILPSLKFKAKYNTYILLLCIFVFGGLISTLFSRNYTSIIYSFWVLSSIMSVLISTKEQVVAAMRYVLVFLMGCLLLGTANGLVPYSIAFSSKSYWPALLITVIIVLHYTEGVKRRVLLYCLLVGTVFIALSGKRMALFISLVFLLLYFRSFLVLITVTVAVFFFFYGFDIIFSLSTFDRLQNLSIESGKIVESNSSSSWSDRRWIYESYISLLKANPMGVGIGQASKVHSMEFYDSRLAGYSPHNSFLGAFVEAGILGGVAYSVLPVIVLFKNRLNLDKFMMLLAICIQMYVEYNSSPGQILFIPYFILLKCLW